MNPKECEEIASVLLEIALESTSAPYKRIYYIRVSKNGS